MSVEIQYDSELSELRDGPLGQQLDSNMRQVAAQLTNWVNQSRAITNRSSLFDRGKYTSSDNVYEQMRTARAALSDDDVVSGAAEVTEGMAFQGVEWESDDPDETDVFNQIAAVQNMDAVIRRMWREEFACSQVVHGFWWDYGTFTVRGKTPKENDPETGEKVKGGNARKKTYKVWFPRAITTLDSRKVVPVGMLQFGQERLAWNATQYEVQQYDRVAQGMLQDELMDRFYAGKYEPRDIDEQAELLSLGVNVESLILLDDRYVHRHTLTKADHERFADVRLKSIFRLLDLKQQLMEADRVQLIGAANYILLVKKGSKEEPAYPEELTNLQNNFNYIAKLPVVFSDHRLEIEIISPKQDYTLQPEKYDVLDNRIIARVLNTLTAAGSRSGQRGDDSLKLGRAVARTMENRRHMMARYLEEHVARAVYDHPLNKGVFRNGKAPKIAFVPGRIQLDDDTGWAQSILQMRTMNELSRKTTLEFFGFDQDIEASRRELEDALGLDDIFKTMVPFGSPGVGGNTGAASGNPTPEELGKIAEATRPPAATGVGAPAAAAKKTPGRGTGATGGRPTGGGTPSKNSAKAPRRTSTGNTSTKGT